MKNIKKVFDDTVVVEDFNLTVKKGEFVTFLGPSGCGKTTTLRMIAGFEFPTEGEILLNGEDISRIPPNLRPINTVFQRYALFPHLNVYDNVAFGLNLKKLPKSVIQEKVRRVLEVVDLEGFEKRRISTLSGGQQQRIAIARAIVNEPDILLLDEPLGALDLKMRQEMQLELKSMHEQLGITFIYVTHDQEEALTMSDKIVVMSDGMIQQIGTPEEIYNEPKNAFVADFIGQANLIHGKLISIDNDGWGHFTVAGSELTARVGQQNPPTVGEEALLVIRPENLRMEPSTNSIAMRIINRLFEGDRIDYHVVIDGCGQEKTFSMSVPFLPGTDIVDVDTVVNVSFHPQAGVIIKG